MEKYEHLLIILMEECAEVQKEVSKALRFGIDDNHPKTKETNKSSIERELADLLGAIELLIEYSVIERPNCNLSIEKKYKIEKWLQYSKKKGRLTE